MQDNKWVLVGIIHGPHGVRGLLKVKSLSDNPARFNPGNRVYAVQQPEAESRITEDEEQRLEYVGQKPNKYTPRELIIESASPHRGKLLISFAGVGSRETAAALIGATLMAEPDAAPLPQGQYYHYQLTGLDVYEQGKYLGKIKEVLSRPANDVYVMQATTGEEVWIPALKTVIKNIDLKAGCMEVELPPGLSSD